MQVTVRLLLAMMNFVGINEYAFDELLCILTLVNKIVLCSNALIANQLKKYMLPYASHAARLGTL